ncbi:MAG: GNAT family N-acetyltransferase, partial [Armatimonadota bacterium]|nr:GNAT family N-acetyltransferase [Armatimonadota bacterium]
MTIRYPRSPEEVGLMADVAAAAFGPNALSEPWRERYAAVEQVFGRSVFLGLEVDGRFVSSCTCIPAQVWVRDRRLTLGAVGGVATLPECRRQGYAGALMRAVVAHMQEQGLALSALWPFSFPYYRKFGWDYASERRHYRFAVERLGALPDPGGVSPAVPEDLPDIAAAYEQHARSLAFSTDRYERWWRELLRNQGVAGFAPAHRVSQRMMVCRDGGQVQGYAVYAFSGGEERRVEVRELVALTADTRLRLVAALAADGAAEVSVRLPANDTWRFQVADPRAVTVTAEPGFSFRVVDPAAALDVLAAPAELRGTLRLRLHDPARPEAILSVAAEVAGGEVWVHRSASQAGGLWMETDIPTFS